MADETDRRSLGWSGPMLRGLNTSLTGNAVAFGFSVTVTVTFGVVSSVAGKPSIAQMVAFALAAVAAFSVLNLVIGRLARTQDAEPEPRRVVLLATATDFLAVGAAVMSAVLLSMLLGGWFAWVLAPFCAGLVYVVVQSVELMVGEISADDGERPA